MMQNDRENIKCVLLGGDYWGQQLLLKTYISGMCPEGGFVESCNNWNKTFVIDNKPINLALWNFSCSYDYDNFHDKLRSLSYPETDVFMLAFSIISSDSFETIRSRFYPEISSLAPDVPFILVGIHLEYRDDTSKQQELQSRGLSMITREAGQKLAKDIGAQQYCECSALTQEGLSRVFEVAARIGLASKKAKKAKHRSLFKWPDFFGKHRKDKDQGSFGKNQPKNIASKPR